MTIATKLYIVTCAANGKMYAGITSRDLATRWHEHVKAYKGQQPVSVLHRAMRKYGLDCFSMEGLFEYPTLAEAVHAEAQVIANLDLTRLGYNVALGGESSPVAGRGHSDATRLKMAASARNRHARQREAAARGEFCYPKHSPDAIEKMRAAATGRKNPAVALRNKRRVGEKRPAAGRKISAALSGRPKSPAHTKAIKEAANRPELLERRRAKRHSADTKLRQSIARSAYWQRRREIAAYSEMSYAGS